MKLSLQMILYIFLTLMLIQLYFRITSITTRQLAFFITAALITSYFTKKPFIIFMSALLMSFTFISLLSAEENKRLPVVGRSHLDISPRQRRARRTQPARWVSSFT